MVDGYIKEIYMIFVTLGTQDKSFHRLLELIDEEIEKNKLKKKLLLK